MAFTYNGISPTEIKYNGTPLTVLQYGTTKVWGKPYSLSISAGANTTITVNRTSSPNQHASTGNLSNGSVIYYGDVLTISYSVSSGYNISTHTVNGTTFTSGTSYTVTSAISVVTTAVSAASWHTVWTGSLDVGNTTAPSTSISGNQERNQTFTVSGLRANTPTIVYISTLKVRTRPGATATFTINESLQTCGGWFTDIANDTTTTTTFTNQSSSYLTNTSNIRYGISINTPTAANTLPVKDLATYAAVIRFNVSSCILTSIQQYY